jgi:ribosomal protein S18 acetylase RimI-like enzyme
MSSAMQRVTIRTPRRDELSDIAAWFAGSGLGEQNLFYLAAFAQPGEAPIGAVAVRPDAGGVARFHIHVIPDARRRKIGTALIGQLRKVATANHARRLVLVELIHQDRPDNAFYRSVGMEPERSFATYAISLDTGFKTFGHLFDRIARQGRMGGAEVAPLDRVHAPVAAEFFARQYGGPADGYLASFQSGRYDLRISCAVMRGREMLAGALVRSRAGEPSVYIELLAATPEFRRGPAALAMSGQIERAARALGFKSVVFEADPRYDAFAADVARRCGASPKWVRYRYAMNV